MLDQLLAPLDYPRQAVANLGRGLGRAFSGEADASDLLRMAPGAGGALASALLGVPAGALVAGGLQGLGRMASPDAFDAPTAGDIVEGLGGDRESFLQTALAHAGTDPLTYAGALQGGRMASGMLRKPMPGFASGPMDAMALNTGPAAEIPEIQAMFTSRAGRMPSAWAEPPPPPAFNPDPARVVGSEPWFHAKTAENEALAAQDFAREQAAMLGARGPAAAAQPLGHEERLNGLLGIYRDASEDFAPLGERLGMAQEFAETLPRGASGLDLNVNNLRKMADETKLAQSLAGADAFEMPVGDLQNVSSRLNTYLGRMTGEVVPALPRTDEFARLRRGTLAPGRASPLLDELEQMGLPADKEYWLGRYQRAAPQGADALGGDVHNFLAESALGFGPGGESQTSARMLAPGAKQAFRVARETMLPDEFARYLDAAREVRRGYANPLANPLEVQAEAGHMLQSPLREAMMRAIGQTI